MDKPSIRDLRSSLDRPVEFSPEPESVLMMRTRRTEMRVPLEEIGKSTFAVKWEAGTGYVVAAEYSDEDGLCIGVTGWNVSTPGALWSRSVDNWQEVRDMAKGDEHDTVINMEAEDYEEE